jgi:hypothetical protein
VLCAALSQAVAKLRFDDTVIRSDVDAAIALMRASQASIEPELQKRTREDPVSRLYLVSPCGAAASLLHTLSPLSPSNRVDARSSGSLQNHAPGLCCGAVVVTSTAK